MEIYDKDLGKVCVTAEGNHSENIPYERLSIVYDPIRRKSYLSRIDVPQGIHIDNTKYWQCIGSGKVNDDCIINLSYVDGNDKLIVYTLQEAISVVNPDDRRVGTLLTFLEKTEDITKQPGWALYQYNSVNIDGWNNLNNWFPIYHNRLKFTGWFDSESELKTALPLPYPGDYAYVGTNYENSTIYKCKEYGIWIDTGVNVQDFLEVVISGDIFINDKGNWVIDGIDTGIYALGVADARGTATQLLYGEKPTVKFSFEDTENQIGKRLVFDFGIPAGKPGRDGENGRNGIDGKNGVDGKDGISTDIASASATVEMISAGSSPSCTVEVSGPGNAKVLKFNFRIPYGGSIPVEYVTFKINPTPSNAEVTINGNKTNIVSVSKGSTVNYTVSADKYKTKSGSQQVNEDTEIDIVLEKDPSTQTVYSNLRIIKDDSYIPPVKEEYTITVNVTPKDAEVKMNNVSGNIQKFEKGTEVEIEISKTGYKSTSMNIVVEKDEEYNITLEQELPSTPVYSNLEIVEDN